MAMQTIRAVLRFVAEVILVLGAAACILVWLEIKPKDIMVAGIWPHWMWLVVSAALFLIAVSSSGYSLRRSFRALPPVPDEGLQRELARVRAWYEQLKEQMTIAQQEAAEARAERDKLSNENADLKKDVFHFQTKFTESMELSGKFMREVEDLYADTVLYWLKNHIRTSGRATVADVAKALGLPDDIVRRGFGWLAKQYEIVRPVPGFADVWSYAVTAADAKFRIIPAKSHNEPSESDPRIYVDDLLDETDLCVPASPLLLQNRGGSVAHNLKIAPFSIGFHEVKFPVLDSLGVGEKKKAVPCVRVSDEDRNSILYLLREQWKAKAEASGHQNEEAVTIPISMTYTDFAGKFEFVTDAEVSYFPGRHEVSRKATANGYADWPHESPAFNWREVRHARFTKKRNET